MKQSVIKFFFFATIWTMSNDLIAQDHMQPAQVVLNNNDTIEGYFDIESWNVSKDVINFSPSSTNIDITKYGPDEVKSFRYGNAYFTGQLVELEMSPRNTISLTKNAEFDLQRKVVFLQVLVDGSKQLLYYEDELDKPHFFFTMDGEVKPLLYKIYLKKMETDARLNERYGRAENHRYRGQLGYYFSDVPQAAAEAQSVQYTVSSMINAYQQYYRYKKAENSGMTDEDKPKYYGTSTSASNFGIAFGLNKYGKPSGSGFTFGLFHSKLLSSKNGNVYWHNELLLLSREFEYEVRSVNSSYQVVRGTDKLRESFFRIGTNVRFTSAEGNDMRPFIGGGAAIEINRSPSDEVEDAAASAFRLNASAGLQGKKAYGELKYDVVGNQFLFLFGIRFK